MESWQIAKEVPYSHFWGELVYEAVGHEKWRAVCAVIQTYLTKGR